MHVVSVGKVSELTIRNYILVFKILLCLGNALSIYKTHHFGQFLCKFSAISRKLQFIYFQKQQVAKYVNIPIFVCTNTILIYYKNYAVTKAKCMSFAPLYEMGLRVI